MLSYLGQKGWTEKGRVPWVTKRRHATDGESRVWGADPDPRPQAPAGLGVDRRRLLVALSIPALGMQFKDPGIDGYSRDLPVMKTYDRIQAAFPGGAVQSQTVIKAKDVTTPEVQAAHRSSCTTRRSPPASSPSRPAIDISPDKTVAIMSRLSVKGSGTDAASNRSVEVLRERGRPGDGRQARRVPTSPSRA